jgi:hypothetical protein
MPFLMRLLYNIFTNCEVIRRLKADGEMAVEHKHCKLNMETFVIDYGIYFDTK